MLRANDSCKLAMKLLSNSFSCSVDELISLCEQLVCCLYKASSQTVNAARANFQAYCWKNACDAMQSIPSPDGHGWIVAQRSCDDGASNAPPIRICWITLPPAPTVLLELVSCGCWTGCPRNRCPCHNAGLLCTSAYSCTSCTNKHVLPGGQSGTIPAQGVDAEQSSKDSHEENSKCESAEEYVSEEEGL